MCPPSGGGGRHGEGRCEANLQMAPEPCKHKGINLDRPDEAPDHMNLLWWLLRSQVVMEKGKKAVLLPTSPPM